MTEPPGCLVRPNDPLSDPLLRRLGWSTLTLCAFAVLLMGLGFLWFVWQVPAEEVTLNRDADGIVALTGGASRIADAIELLASGRGKRLLISGAYRATNSKEISRLNPEFERWVRCCVDFDRSLNTLGNAIETKRWAEQPRLPLADRGDVQLSHAARARRNRASASRRCAGALSGRDRPPACASRGGRAGRRRG